ncbi:MAG: peptidase M29, partial [Proteobacteria bacterium]|nr:peptidase M29 [Pseudomonadota bacterium]
GSSLALTGQKKAVEALSNVDFIVDLTVEGLMHSAETMGILQAGARIMNISNEHPDILSRNMPDQPLKERTLAASRLCRKSKLMKVTSDAGTSLSVNMTNNNTVGVWGWTDKPGTLAHWPGGIVVSFPKPDSVNGRLVFQPGDMNLTFKKYFESEVIFTINNDFVTQIDGNGSDAKLMKNYFQAFGDKECYATSHVGWGLSETARYEALTMYDKCDLNGAELRSISGNFLYSTGANEFAGRFTEGHFDLPMMECTITLDDVCVVKAGKLVS